MWRRLAVCEARAGASYTMLLLSPLLFAQPTASLLRTLEITARVRTDNAPRTCGERIIFCHIKYFYNIRPRVAYSIASLSVSSVKIYVE